MKRNPVAFVILLFLMALIPFFCYKIYKQSFKNYAGSGNWPIVMKDYKLSLSKTEVESIIVRSATKRNYIYKPIENDTAFNRFQVMFPIADDTVEYVIKYKGDSLDWKNENETTILLFSIVQKKKMRIFEAKNKSAAQELISFFEENFISTLK